MIKWTVKDVLEAFEKAMSSSPQAGNGQLLQQLRDKAQPSVKQPQIRR